MARFTDEEIERIKREVSLVRLVESQGYVLTKKGKGLEAAIAHPEKFHGASPFDPVTGESNATAANTEVAWRLALTQNGKTEAMSG